MATVYLAHDLRHDRRVALKVLCPEPAAVIGAERTLVASAATEFFPSLSPDGRWLAYSSNESGMPEIYVRPFPETGTARWQVSTTGGAGPCGPARAGSCSTSTARAR